MIALRSALEKNLKTRYFLVSILSRVDDMFYIYAPNSTFDEGFQRKRDLTESVQLRERFDVSNIVIQ